MVGDDTIRAMFLALFGVENEMRPEQKTSARGL